MNSPGTHSKEDHPEALRPLTAPASAPPLAEPPSLRAIAQVFAGITLGTLAIFHAGRALALAEYTHVTLAALFLIVAVRGAERAPGGLRRHGLWLGGLLEPPARPSPGTWGSLRDLLSTLSNAAPSAVRETAAALAVAAVTFPPFILGFYLFHQPLHAFSFQPIHDPVDYMLSQLLVIALPEEALFRGYLQTRLSDRFPLRNRVFGTQLSLPALTLQAGLFAMLHFVVEVNPARLAVFFPALLFGFLREARGGVGAAIIYHALCNLLSDVLVRGFL